MSYIPVFKNKLHEKEVIKKYNEYFVDDILPCIEVMLREVETDNLKDENGKSIKKVIKGKYTSKGNPCFEFVKDETTRRDVTVNRIKESLCGKKALIDFFRFSTEVYGESMSDDMIWSYQISRNWESYKECFREIENDENLFPVLSLKDDVVTDIDDVGEFLFSLQEGKNIVAFRITLEYYYNHQEVLDNIIIRLRDSDYLLFDINENTKDSLEAYSDDIKNIFNNMNLKCKKIILHSPRARKLYNVSFDNGIARAAIDNWLMYDYLTYNADGFGDYVGVADAIAAIRKGYYSATVIYNLKDKCFYSFKMPGKNFSGLKQRVLEWPKIKENQYKICKGIEYAKYLNPGYFPQWKQVSMLCYLNAVLIHLGKITL